ncbi:hypothetical protein CIRG_03900 [Coccidioides immitis RMSCC 2394]|uniref:Uncharacterized protein n=1 Tax=Coccidioides immitis RMSCC 2394 TaxID=404692 RepID=A0A0J6YAY7_COCIT|nr:hypothetical protein CIRG_03900 [Coccidioides immitis RMSCC 2394]
MVCGSAGQEQARREDDNRIRMESQRPKSEWRVKIMREEKGRAGCICINRSRVRRDGPHPETEKYQRSRVIQARRGKKRNINANAGGLVGWSGCSNGFLEVWVVGRSGRRRDMYGCRTREIKVWAGRSVFMQGGGSNAVRQPGRCNWGESNSKRQEKKHEKSMQSLTGEDQQRRQQQQQKKKQLV